MWMSRRELARILRELGSAEARAERAENALEHERSENRISERHLTNQFLRKMNAYPQQPVREDVEKSPYIPKPVYDPGELTAVIEEAARLGVAEKDAREMFAREKGIDTKLIH
jgi:hypothetical protein